MARERRIPVCKGFYSSSVLKSVKLRKPIKVNDYIILAPITYHMNAFYVFGGSVDYSYSTNIIGRFDTLTMTWRKAGELKSERYGHGAIFNGEMMIIAGGGGGLYKTESCSIQNGVVNCTEHAPALNFYAYYPAMLLVDAKTLNLRSNTNKIMQRLKCKVNRINALIRDQNLIVVTRRAREAD